MNNQSEIDKNIINLSVYEIKNEKDLNDDPLIVQLYAYTALWCGPCKRIKPKLIEIMSKHNYKLIREEIIEKSIFKRNINEFVPFFVVMKSGQIECPDGMEGCEVFHWGIKKVDSIQTSDEMLFAQFLIRNINDDIRKLPLQNFILDDNF
jgi:thiol-disulfide isomerase/thioredoxin